MHVLFVLWVHLPKARDHFLIVKIWRNKFNKYLKYVVINNKLLKIRSWQSLSLSVENVITKLCQSVEK